jgi:Subtilisin inhibitor-like
MTLHAVPPGQLRSRRTSRAGRPVRPRALMTMMAAVAAAAIAVTGCASGSSGGGASNGGSGSDGSAPAKVSLTFQVTHGAGSPAFQHWTLHCDPAGGTHPAPAATCASLLKLKNPFAPQNKHMNCPMILRSDRRIVVTGSWFGQKVHRVVLDGGCDLGLYAKLHQIFH